MRRRWIDEKLFRGRKSQRKGRFFLRFPSLRQDRFDDGKMLQIVVIERGVFGLAYQLERGGKHGWHGGKHPPVSAGEDD